MTGKLHISQAPQPEHFEFTPEHFEQARAIIARYPAGRQQSAVMPLLTLAQKQHDNWLPKAAMDYVAQLLGMAPVRVYEVASFYTMYNLEPVGKYLLEVCTTTPCWLRGSDAIMDVCQKKLGIGPGETTADGKFTLREVECLGACVNAPMCQVGEHFYEDLTPEIMSRIIDVFASGGTVKPGPQGNRKSSEPEGATATLKGDK